MTKEEWQRLYDILKTTHKDFLLAYPNFKDGKNKAIRNEAERKVENSIALADYHLKSNWDAFKLLTGEEADGFDRKLVHDEFLHPHYFRLDMPILLDSIEQKINTL